MFRIARGLLLLLAVCAAGQAYAQFGASVQGTTQDSTGANLAGATVTLLNRDTKVTQSVLSNSEGTYRFNSLAPGNYAVTATMFTFATATTNFILQTNEQRNVPFDLSLGSIATTVDVTSQAPLLDTSDSRNQQTLDTKALEELPVAGRNPLSLITLTPGVVGKGSNNAINFNAENYTDASANGRGSNGNQYIVDGLDSTSNARAGVTNLTPNVDALAETTVQVNRYDVDFARSSSIQTVMTTKAGTQQFHGFASAYYTWQELYAKSYFNHPLQVGPPIRPSTPSTRRLVSAVLSCRDTSSSSSALSSRTAPSRRTSAHCKALKIPTSSPSQRPSGQPPLAPRCCPSTVRQILRSRTG